MANIPKFDSHADFIFSEYKVGKSVMEITRMLLEKGCKASDSGLRKFLRKNGVAVRGTGEARKLMGLPGWNKGKTYKQKNPCKNRSDLVKGSKNPQWKGGKTAKGALIRSSKEYEEWRNAVFIRDNYTCVFCGAKSGKGVGRVFLEADHILPFSTHIELRLEVSNGRTLCRKCHKSTPTYGRNIHATKD